MEQVLKLLANVKIESESAVAIVKWMTAIKGISGVLIAIIVVGGMLLLVKGIYKIYDRTVEK